MLKMVKSGKKYRLRKTAKEISRKWKIKLKTKKHSSIKWK